MRVLAWSELEPIRSATPLQPAIWRLTLVILWVLQRSWAIALNTQRMYVQPTIEQLTEALECLDLNAYAGCQVAIGQPL